MKTKRLNIIILFIFATSILFAQQQYIVFDQDISPSTITEPTRIITDNGLDGVTIEYNFKNAIVHNRHDNNTYFQYFYIKGFTQSQELGKPMLPVHTDLIYIPQGANFTIETLDSSSILYNNFNIFPALKPVSDNSGASEPIFFQKAGSYQSSSFYPNKVVKLKGVIKIKGLSFAMIEVHPMQIKTFNGKLKLINNIKYRVSFQNCSSLINCENFSKEFLHQVVNISLNNYNLKQNIDQYFNSPNSVIKDKVDFLIITHQDLIKAADSLATWKKQLGYRTKVIKNISWTPNNIKERINNLQQNTEYDFDYIILLGSTEKLPSINISNIANTVELSDLGYACFDGSSDYFPDANISRISVNDSIEAMNTVRKIINYEKNPSNNSNFYSTTCNITNYIETTSSSDKNRYTETTEEISSLLESQSYTVNRLYKSDNNVNPQLWNNDIYSDGNNIPNQLKKPNYAWNSNSNNIIQNINNGRFLMFYRGQSWTGGWSSHSFSTNSLSALNNNNKLPVIFSVGGKSGNFSDPNCLATSLLKKNNSGAVAVFANSTTSYSGFNNGIALSLIDAIWPNNSLITNFQTVYNNGQAPTHYSTKQLGYIKSQSIAKMIEIWGSNESFIKSTLQSFNLFGDASMKIWTHLPQTITIVTTDSLLCNYDTSIIINSSTDGIATLLVNNELIARKNIKSGIDTLFFQKVIGNKAILTISSEGFKPSIIDIPIYGNCIFSSFTISSSSFCIIDSFNVNNLSSINALNYNWNFGDGASPSSAQGYGPFNISYISGGPKEIKLIVTDSNNNTSEHIEEIIVDSQCVKAIPFNGNIITTECSGMLCDNGFTGNYSNNTFGSYTISPIGASMVYLQFIDLDLANSADRIDIYDGPNTDSPLLLSLYGSSIPVTPILSTGSSITIQQISDAHINGEGFLLRWQCIKNNTSPTANLICYDSISCSNTIQFYNTSKEADQSIWYFGDGQSSIEQHPLHTYAQNGTYNVKLIVSNSHGTDSIVKNNYIVINQIAPPIIANEIRCNSGTVEFNIQTNNTIYWYGSSNANLPLDSGAQFITPIIQNTTSYYVSQRHYSSPLSVGKVDSASSGSYLNLGGNKGLMFDVNNTSTLISIEVYANSNGSRSFFLFNSAGELIYNKQIDLVVGKNTLDLNWSLNQGINYKICTNSNSNLFYNTSNVAFPYTDANNNISIKNSDFSNVYLYFYNWKLRNKSCVSPKVEVLAIISDTLKPKSLFDISTNGLSVEFNNNSEYANTYYWDFGDGDFSLLTSPTHNYQYDGLYEVNLIASNDCGLKTMTKHLQLTNTSLSNNKSIDNLKVFPNPTSSILNIEFETNSANKVSIKLYSLLGQTMFNRSIELKFQKQNIQINTNKYTKGVYILSIETEGNIIQRRVIIE